MTTAIRTFFEVADVDGDRTLSAGKNTLLLRAVGSTAGDFTLSLISLPPPPLTPFVFKDEFHAAMSHALSDPDALNAMFEAARTKKPQSGGGGEGSAATTSSEEDAEATLLFELLDLNRDGNLSRIEVVSECWC